MRKYLEKRDVFLNQEQVKEKGVLALETAKSMTWDSSASKITSLI